MKVRIYLPGSLPSRAHTQHLIWSIKTLMKKHIGTPTWEDSISVGCDLRGSKCESPGLSAWFPAIPCTQATYLIWSIILTKKHVGSPIWEDLNSTRVGCDLGGGSKCESPHLSAWFCVVPCHPVHIGNIPNLIYSTLIKEHVGTQTWADYISIGCDLGGSKIWSLKTSCIKKHGGTPILSL